MNEPVLRVEHGTIRFGGLKALSDCNLEIRRGDLKGLIGHNGAGKTTAFNILTGVYRPTSGNIFMVGQWGNGAKPHQIDRLGLARTFQNIRLFRALTAIDNVRVACLTEAAPLVSAERLDAIRRKGGGLARFAPLLDSANDYYDCWRALILTPAFQREEEGLHRRPENC